MMKKNWILPALFFLLVTASLTVVGFSSRPASKTQKDNSGTCCLEKNTKECIAPSAEPAEMTLDNLSTQFLSIPVLGY